MKMLAIEAVIAIAVTIQMVSAEIGNETIKVKVEKGETVVLKCSISVGEMTWLGPDFNNAEHGVEVYFLNHDKNPKLMQTKFSLQTNEGNYDMIIVHFQEENTGCYICRVSGDGLFHETRYNVSLLYMTPSSTIMYDEGSIAVPNTTVDWKTNTTQITEGEPNENPYSCNSTPNYEFWKVSGSFVGGFVVCLIFSNIYCYIKHKKASNDILEVPRDVQYDEIGIITYNVVSSETLHDDIRDRMSVFLRSGTNIDTWSSKSPTLSYSSTNDSLSRKTEGSENTYQSINLDQNHTQEHRKSVGNTIPPSSVYDIDTHSIRSTTLSFRSDGSENTYELINLDQNHIHEFKTCNVSTTTLTSVYENTVVFPITSQKLKGDQGDKTPWLFIYNRIEN